MVFAGSAFMVVKRHIGNDVDPRSIEEDNIQAIGEAVRPLILFI